ncbi:MAG: 6-phosphogluconolactonase [Actinomycetota bacterium]
MARPPDVTFLVEALDPGSYDREVAARIALDLPGRGSVVLTGGTTAARIYGCLARADAGWGDLDVFFSDERCVPPDDDASNFGMAARLLLEPVGAPSVHRMRGEDDPEEAARAYGAEVSAGAAEGFDLVLLGMGSDCHIAALFPGSPALAASELCVAVERPDGLGGLTLTPPALLASRTVLVVVAGGGKAEAVRRAVAGGQEPQSCPARLLAEHPNATFLLDEGAASLL